MTGTDEGIVVRVVEIASLLVEANENPEEGE